VTFRGGEKRNVKSVFFKGNQKKKEIINIYSKEPKYINLMKEEKDHKTGKGKNTKKYKHTKKEKEKPKKTKKKKKKKKKTKKKNQNKKKEEIERKIIGGNLRKPS